MYIYVEVLLLLCIFETEWELKENYSLHSDLYIFIYMKVVACPNMSSTQRSPEHPG